jgi:hypothetical protein
MFMSSMPERASAQTGTPVPRRRVGAAGADEDRDRSGFAALDALATLGSAIWAAPSLMLSRFSDDADAVWEPFLRDDEPHLAPLERVH